jgi:hypothetical protein
MNINDIPENTGIMYEEFLGDKKTSWTIAKRKGTALMAYHVSIYASRPFRYWLKVVPDACTERGCFDVVTKEGECFRVKMGRVHGCIAGCETLLSFFGFGKVYATWATKDIEAHRKRWSKKAANHSWLN